MKAQWTVNILFGVSHWHPQAPRHRLYYVVEKIYVVSKKSLCCQNFQL